MGSGPHSVVWPLLPWKPGLTIHPGRGGSGFGGHEPPLFQCTTVLAEHPPINQKRRARFEGEKQPCPHCRRLSGLPVGWILTPCSDRDCNGLTDHVDFLKLW